MKDALTQTAARLARLQHRKSRAVFGRQVASEAARLTVPVEDLAAAIREAREQMEGRRRAAQASSLAEQDRSAAEAELWDTVPARLAAAGWILTHTSESGSRYYERRGETLRLADHLVPASIERDAAAASHGWQPQHDREIIAGQRGWRRAVEEACGH